jgi:hypothetical protein
MRPTRSVETASPSTQLWWSYPGLVYFLSVGAPPIAVKIGMLAVTPKTTLQSAITRRLASIQSANHELVQVLGAIHFTEGQFPTKDAEDYERKLHIEFAHLARFVANSRGAEWFTAAPDLLARISDISKSLEALGLPRHIGKLLVTTEDFTLKPRSVVMEV